MNIFDHYRDGHADEDVIAMHGGADGRLRLSPERPRQFLVCHELLALAAEHRAECMSMPSPDTLIIRAESGTLLYALGESDRWCRRARLFVG